jgi:nitroreductase
MHPVIETILNRKSIRAYRDRPVTEEEKQIILQAAMRAPTAGNMMLYSILDIQDQRLKDQLVITCDNQPFIAKAPLVLLFAADYQRWYDFYLLNGVEAFCHSRGEKMRRPQEGDLLLACCDTLIAAQTAVLAAEALGIGSCYIGDILENFETHQEMFALPRYVLPITLVCFGYPTEKQAAHKLTPRFDSNFIVHTDRYQRLGDRELAAMFRARSEQFAAAGERPDGIQNLGHYSYKIKFGSDFAIEMSRSVKAMIKSWTD